MKRYVCFLILALTSIIARAEDMVTASISYAATYTQADSHNGMNVAFGSLPVRGVLFSQNPATYSPIGIAQKITVVPGATYPIAIDLLCNQYGTPAKTDPLNVTKLAVNIVVPSGYIPVFDGVARRQITYTIDPAARTTQKIKLNLRLIPLNNDLGFRAGMATPLSVEQTFWRISLGNLLNGQFAGWLAVNNLTSESPLGATFALDNVMCDAGSSAVSIVYQKDTAGNVIIGTNGVPIIKQVHAPQVSIDIVSTQANHFEYKCYHPSLKSSTPDVYGRYSFSGDPFAWYIGTIGANDAAGVSISADFRDVTAQSPSNNSVVRTMVTSLKRTGTAPSLTLTATSWCESGSSPLVSVERDFGTNTDTISYVDNSSSTATTSMIRARSVSGTQITGEVAGTTKPLSMSYIYDPASFLLSTATDNKSGAVTKYSYSALGLPSTQTNAYKDTASQSVVATIYQVDSFGDATRPKSVTRKVNGVTVGQSTFGCDDSFAAATNTYTAASYPFAGHSTLGLFTTTRSDDQGLPSAPLLISKTTRFAENVGTFSGFLADDFYSGQLYSTTLPNGRRDSYVQQRGTWADSTTTFTPSGNNGVDAGPASRICIIRGIQGPGSAGTAVLYSSYGGYLVDTVYLIPGVSTMDVTIRDSYANVVRTESYVYSAGTWNQVSYADFTYSLDNQLVSRTTSAGTTYSATYSGGRLQNETDESGTYASYLYDAADRVKSITRAGVTLTRGYDALNHITSESVSDGTETISSSRLYDDAGRIYSETSPDHGTVSHSYDPATLSHTATFPSLATQTEIRYLDGRVKSITGSGVVAQYYDYGVDTSNLEFSSVSFGSSSSSRWTKTTVDHLGRQKSTVAPSPMVLNQSGGVGAGTLVTTSKTYDTSGRLSTLSRTGYATEYFNYDDYSQLNRAGLDVDSNAALSNASNDRLVDYNTAIQKVGSDWWLVKTSTIYPIAGSSTSFTASKAQQRLSGFTSGIVSEVQLVDIDGNTSKEITTLSPSTATLTVSTTIPGHVKNALKKYVNGMAQSFTDFEGLSTTYGYDTLNRLQTVKDEARSNTTTVYYYLGTTLVSTVIDGASQPTSFGYDAMGRTTAVVDAQNHTVYCDYTNRNQIQHQWGSGSYPIAYSYDPTFGTRTGMTTYRSTAPSSWSDTTWPTSLPTTGDTTTWAFDSATGVLTSKTDAQSNPVSYTYNELGQTATITSSRGIVSHYAYDPATSELKGVTYDNYNDPNTSRGTISTLSLGYTYTRLGQLSTVTDASGKRVFDYDPLTPWRKKSETLSAYFDSRSITDIYESSTSTTDGSVLGRNVGFDLANSGAELHQKFTVSNLGRITGLNTKTGTSAAVDFSYGYRADGLYSGYTQGSLGVSMNYETTRDLLSQVKGAWGSSVISQFDYINNALGKRQYSQQSGSAFAVYGGAIFRASAYNDRGELRTSAMYNGAAPDAETSPSSSLELPARRYEYRFDDIGNRKTVGETGLDNGADEIYDTNSLNQYSAKENNSIRVLGTVAAGAKVAGVSSDNRIVELNTNGNTFGGDLVPVSTDTANGTLTVFAAISNGAHVSSVTTNWKIPAASQSFFYDKDGNLIDDGLRQYFYDAENRLVKVSTASTGQTVQLTYDYLNRRIEKKVTTAGTTTTTRFIYDGFNLVEEIDGVSFGSLRTYSWGLDSGGGLDRTGAAGGLAQIRDLVASKTLLPTYDANGNVAALINASSGSTEAIYEYSPSGELLRSEGSYATANHFRFATKYQDDEFDLIYFGQRYYSAAWGRFINRDPIQEDGGMNLYAYSANDSVNTVDTLGLVTGDLFYSGGGGSGGLDVYGGGSGGNYFNVSISIGNSAGSNYGDYYIVPGPRSIASPQVTSTGVSSNKVQGAVGTDRALPRGVALNSAESMYTPYNYNSFTAQYYLIRNARRAANAVAAANRRLRLLVYRIDHPSFRGNVRDLLRGVADTLMLAGGPTNTLVWQLTGQSPRFIDNKDSEGFPLVSNPYGPYMFGNLLTEGIVSEIAAWKSVPNPGGRLGDEITAGTREGVIADLQARGFTQYETEVFFEKGPLGVKNRFADVVTTNPDTGETVIVNIGEMRGDGLPIMRERQAFDDIIFSPTILEYPNSRLLFIEKGASGLPAKF